MSNSARALSLLTGAKSHLITRHPFFASLLLSLPLKEDPSLPTAATNGKEIRFSPDFIASLSQAEVTFLLAHEVLHCVFMHMMRRGERDPQRWNIAADYVINETLLRERDADGLPLGVMPKGGLRDSALFSRGGGTAEGIYPLLPVPPEGEESPKPGEPGGALDSLESPGETEAEVSQTEAEMRVKVIQARNAAKACGRLSGDLERLISEAVRPRVDWRSALRHFLTRRARVDLSYARPKRRFMGEDFTLPSLTGVRLGSVAVAVDFSGSVSPETLAVFSAELNAILEDVRPESVRVLTFDHSVKSDVTLSEGEPVALSARAGGGTAFSPIFSALREGEAPSVCIVLTDLECDDFGPAPDFPVLWAVFGSRAKSLKKDETPFGETLPIEE